MTLIRTVSMRRLRSISETGLRWLARHGLNAPVAMAFACAGIWATPVGADLVSPYGGETAPNFVELSVNDDHVRVALEIDLNDYPYFVIPDDGSGASLAERTGRNFDVLADGIVLERVVHALDVRPRAKRQTAATAMALPRPRSEKVVFVEMAFPLQQRPERITFIPPLNKDGIPLASLGMVADHADVPVTDYRYLSRAETMIPNWEDPWYSSFENPNLTRHHKSPLMSFLSMEPREVRHEIIFRLKDLEAWADLDLGTAERLSAGQVAAIKDSAAAFFGQHNPVIIDGVNVAPASVNVSRIAVGAEGLRILPDEADADRTTMLMGVVLSYPHSVLARTVEMHWDLFPDGVDIIPLTLSDPAGSVPGQIYRADPVVTWTNHLTAWDDPQTTPVVVRTAGTVNLPLLAMGFGLATLVFALTAWWSTSFRRTLLLGACGACVAAAVMTFPVKQALSVSINSDLTEMTSHAVMQGLLDNVSTAMLEPQDEAFVAALDPFVDEGNQASVGTELRRGLSVTLPSGAVAKTDGILDLQVESITPGQSRTDHQILANWTAQVSGSHWGHFHRQAVIYRGLVNVSQQGDEWQLEGLTILSAKSKG